MQKARNRSDQVFVPGKRQKISQLDNSSGIYLEREKKLGMVIQNGEGEIA